MGFTIEDLMVTSKDRYQMQMVAGQTGWSNSISWVLMLEDRTIIKRFDGKELAVTTGMGFRTQEAWLELAADLTEHHASGLIINIGDYTASVPESLITYCNTNDLPLWCDLRHTGAPHGPLAGHPLAHDLHPDDRCHHR